MIFNLLFGIWCEECKKYIDPCEVWINVLYEGSITCDKDHLVGNEWDIQWIEFLKEGIKE